MRIFKYALFVIHIVAVLSVMIYTLLANHAVMGRGFVKCDRSEELIYLTEDAGSFTVLYQGDAAGKASAVYRSNQSQSKAMMVDFSLVDDVYILEQTIEGYAVKKLSVDHLVAMSNTKPFMLDDVEKISDFYVNLGENMAYITAIRTDGIGVNVYSINLANLFPLGSDESKLQSGETAAAVPVRFRFDAVDTSIKDAYYDGTNIITEKRPPLEDAINPNSYSTKLNLSVGQSLKTNIGVFMLYIAYAIIGVLLIILITRLIERHRSFIDHIIFSEIIILVAMALGSFLFDNILLAFIWAVVASILNVLVIWYGHRDIKVLCDNMKRITAGNLDLEKPKGNSMETAILWRGINEVKYLYEEYRYFYDSTTAAVLRFLPHNVGSLFRINSLDEIKPGDNALVSGIYMTLRTKKEISNTLVAMTEDYEKKADGMLLTGECSFSQLRMMFLEKDSEPVNLGIDFLSEIGDDEAGALYFKDSFKLSVVGTDTKSILNITSAQTETMERLGEWFFDMGIRMVITEEVKELSWNLKSPLRYIGYCYIDGEKKSFYEVLNIYPERTRTNRLGCLEDFDGALNLLYQGDYYLARTAFTEILKVDPSDELTRWYLFICEKHLNNPELSDKSCALDPKN